MTSEGDARENEPDRSGSGFGPPLGEFGPPISEFGPPTGADTGPRWSLPEQQTDHPELIWRPAAEPETAPASPPQYRAPDSTDYSDRPPAPAPAPAPPAPAPAPAPPAPAPAPPARSDSTATAAVRPPTRNDEKDAWWNQPTAEGGVPKPPSSTDSGLSWAEDPIAMRLALRVPSTPAPTRRTGPSKRRIVLGALAALIVLIALTVTIVSVSENNGDEGASPGAGGKTTAALSCPSSKEGKVTVGNGAGDTASGPGAILGFQNAFYVARNGERARSFVAPDADFSTAAVIQKAIDEQIPAGATHCVRITEVGADSFDVDLTEHRPDGTTIVYRQSVTTVDRDGKKLVSIIRER
ncbi:hypothetical protein AB0C34_29430 [Nocardia sp. NPDC049220]|uniref:hypothetical protein n=1 Tax=Nocardia sp. NPDC049220 TaxID=3155273 RepID=UPI0033F020E9